MHDAVLSNGPRAQQPASSAIDPWRFVRRGTDRSGMMRDESLFALANGQLGVRGGLEECPGSSHASFMASVWERTPIEYHERFPGFARHSDTRIPVVDGIGIEIQLDGVALDLEQGEWLAFERCLDLRNGCYRRTLRWRSPGGTTLDIEAERLVPLEHPALLAIRYRVRSIDHSGQLRLCSRLDGARHAAAQGDDPRIGARMQGGLSIVATGIRGDRAWMEQTTRYSGIRVACAQSHGQPMSQDGETRPEATVTQCLDAALEPGRSVELCKYVAYAWSRPGSGEQNPELVETALARSEKARKEGFDALLQQQADTLGQFWDAADLQIQGDPVTEQALRLNLFHVMQSTSRDGSGSAAAKGLTGEGYEGHYFWDAEAFMLPALLATDPARARNMLEYRYRILDAARAHAREMNHGRGALYAWRTLGGDECSAYFPSGSAQYHINAAVAWALQSYVEASGDEDFLADMGAEILFETARLWLDVGSYNPRRGDAFCICGVTGPDEYTALVDNNHYTNRMAQRHLGYAASVAHWLADSRPAVYDNLVRRIGLEPDEPVRWRQAAEAMYLPVDPQTGVFPQDDTFLDRPRLPIRGAFNGKHPLLLRMHPLTLYRHQVCKQADVVLAMVLAGENVDPGCKRRNLDYYESVTVHDSTLSAASFGVLAAEVGDMDRAWRYFIDGLRVDLDDLHGNTAHGVHLASMAGSWQVLAWGFGGLRIRPTHPAFAPRLPRAWDAYRFGLRWRDARLRIEVDTHGAHYTLMQGVSLRIEHDGQRIDLKPGQTVSRALAAGTANSKRTFPRPFRGIAFDLDGVLADTASVHEAAWRRLASEIGVPLADNIGERLKGVDRRASLDIVLEQATRHFDEDERARLAARKNEYYRDCIAQFGPDHLLPGAREVLMSVRDAGIRTALASASRNAPLLLERLGITDLFDYVVDANRIRCSKPDPEIYLAAAAGLGLAAADCIGIEDAAAGIASIRAAGMAAVGIGDAASLAAADAVIPDIRAFDPGVFWQPRDAGAPS